MKDIKIRKLVHVIRVNIGEMLEINKIYNMDCLEGLAKLEDDSIDLIVTDPPYNINKDTWDKIDNYEDWLMDVFKECSRVLKDNGSFYFFHSEMPIVSLLMTRLDKETPFIFRQFIVWNKRFNGSKNKGYLDGYVEVEALRNYQQMAEYILYYTFQDETGLSKIMDSCVYPIRDYIRKEIIKSKGGVNLNQINQVLGTATSGGGVASAVLSLDKTCPAFITEEHYLKLREWLNEDLRKEYKYLRKEYKDLRYCFNNQKSHHSVWNYDIERKQGHITPKPLKLIQNILKHSSKENTLILDPFMGSGTTAVACKQLNRNFIGFEINPEYCKIAEERLKAVPEKLDNWFGGSPNE